MLSHQLNLPKCNSSVEGFSVQPELGEKAGEPYHPNVAHNGFIKLTVAADGRNLFYPGSGTLAIYLYFIYPEADVVYTFVDEYDDAFYISVPTDDEILDVCLAITHEDPDYSGVNLVLTSRQLGVEPYYSLLLVPDISRMQ